MNKIVNKFLLTVDKFMPEMQLGQRRVTYSTCGPFTKTKNEYKKKYEETRDSRHVYQKKLDKACFQQIWLMEILKI